MKVCFFSPTAYAYFRPDATTWAGGAETQQVLVGRHLASRGVSVSFIVGDYGQREIENDGGITLIRSFTPFKGNRKLRFLPDMLSIRRAMILADADVYNQRSTAFFTGQIAWFARCMGRAFTFSVGSDYNIYRDCQGNLPPPMAALYRWGIARADAVIAQTEKQQRIMREQFKREIVLIRNGIIISDEGSVPARPASPPAAPPAFLWVGGLRWMKRAEIFVELARRVPEARFILIGGKVGNEAYYRSIMERLREAPNVRQIDFVPPDEIDAYYRDAYALVNTSSLEGFPNTFLHAWRHGVPVLSLEIDPDDTIVRNRLGVVGGTIDGLAGAVRSLLANPASRNEMSSRALSYVREHHDVSDRAGDYLRLFEALSARRNPGAPR